MIDLGDYLDPYNKEHMELWCKYQLTPSAIPNALAKELGDNGVIEAPLWELAFARKMARCWVRHYQIVLPNLETKGQEL